MRKTNVAATAKGYQMSEDFIDAQDESRLGTTQRCPQEHARYLRVPIMTNKATLVTWR